MHRVTQSPGNQEDMGLISWYIATQMATEMTSCHVMLFNEFCNKYILVLNLYNTAKSKALVPLR